MKKSRKKENKNLHLLLNENKKYLNLKTLDFRNPPVQKIPISICDIETLEIIYLSSDNFPKLHSHLNFVLQGLFLSRAKIKKYIATQILLVCLKQLKQLGSQEYFYFGTKYAEQYIFCDRDFIQIESSYRSYLKFGLSSGEKYFLCDSVNRIKDVSIFFDLDSLKHSMSEYFATSCLSETQHLEQTFLPLLKNEDLNKKINAETNNPRKTIRINKEGGNENKNIEPTNEPFSLGLYENLHSLTNKNTVVVAEVDRDKTQELLTETQKDIDDSPHIKTADFKLLSKSAPQTQILKHPTEKEELNLLISSPNSLVDKKKNTQNTQFNFIDPQTLEDARRKQIISIIQRRGQHKFRSILLNAYENKCAITHCDLEAALEAAHIIPYRGDHTNRVDNGLLLRADIHTLFDLYLISINPESYSVVINKNLWNTCYQTLAGVALRLPELQNEYPHPIALKEHYNNFLKRQSK